MSTSYRSITAVLLSVLLVIMGQGVLNTIVPLAAKAYGYKEFELGLLSSAYFGGMLLGALVIPAAIRHAGHVRVFVAAIAICAITALTYTFASQAWFWILLRMLGGLSIAGLYATVESWLQGKSDNTSRGSVLAVYSIVQYIAWASGNVLLQFAQPTDFALFAATAICFCAGILPLTVAEQDPPERPQTPKLPFRWLFRTAPLGLIGTFLVGLNNGPMWSLSPVYASDLGLSSADVGTYMIMITIGSAVAQLPIGRLQDRFDRRIVAVILLALTSAVELTFYRYGSSLSRNALFGLNFMLGIVVSTQYYIFAALTNDRTGPSNAVGVAAVLLFSYCCGAVIGPNTAAALMALIGPAALHLHDSVIHATLALISLSQLLSSRRPARG